MSFDDLPDEWVVWNEEREKVVLVYRPDVFDGNEFPAPCLPTLYLTRGKRGRRPGKTRVGTNWHVRLSLEPDVELTTDSATDRERGVDRTVELAATFATGSFDLSDAYQHPRDDYVAKLQTLTEGRVTEEERRRR